jgi:AbrB family looped-hinge helix DNA binding protein
MGWNGIKEDAAVTRPIKVPRNGRVVLPLDMREKLGINDGGELLVVENDDGTFSLMTRLQVARQMQRRYKEMIADREGYSVDDFIADRRREAALEDAKYE